MATDEDLSENGYHNLGMDDPHRATSVLPWDRFQNWLHCICIVTFDLELGQAMEMVYPSHIKLTEKEKTNICYLSFPDSNSGILGDTQFHFRIRRCPSRLNLTTAQQHYNRHCPPALQCETGHYYGHVFFRQMKDKTIRRGYFQKSLVLITKLPFITLNQQLVNIIAPQYFENGEPSLEAACHDVDQWPQPIPGDTLHLPIMGSVIQARIPCRADKVITPQQIKNPDMPILPANHILPSVFEVDQFSAFQPVLPHIQMLWELVLTAEPIIVMASLPTVCANTVQAFVSLIWPLNYCCDYRPFFTIHDTEFKEYTTKTQAPPNVILGVTNPFFAKTLQHWPHIVRIGEMQESAPKGFNKLKKGSSLKTLDSKPGVYTRYKPFLSKDKTILKRLAKETKAQNQARKNSGIPPGIQTKRPLEVQNAMLKRHLLELTQSFMIPLERYVASLMPLQRNISPYKGPPRLRPFDQEDFLKTLEQSGPQLTSGIKGDWAGLYRKFFRCAHFEGWLRYRQREVNQKLQALHVEAMCEADLMTWIQDKQEVEIVDLILRLREKLKYAENDEIPVSPELRNKLQDHLHTIISSLPSDLQSVLHSN